MTPPPIHPAGDEPHHLGSAIRRARLSRGWSQTVLAAKIAGVRRARGEAVDETSVKTQVSRWENGRVAPDRLNVEVIAEACSATPEALFGLTESALPRPILQPGDVTAATIGRLEAQRVVHAQTEHSFGPAIAAALVESDRRTIHELLRITPAELSARMHALAALTAEMGGWIGQESGDAHYALAQTVTAHGYAQAAQDPAIEAMVLMRWANLVAPGDHQLGATLIERAAAIADELPPSRLHAAIARQRAHVAAVAGDHRGFSRYARAAADYSHATDGLTPYATPAYVASETAASLLVLERPAEAVQVLAEHIAVPGTGQERDDAVAAARWLQALAGAGDVGAALDSCEAAVVAYRRAPSMRAQTALRSITTGTDARGAELRSRIRDALRRP